MGPVGAFFNMRQCSVMVRMDTIMTDGKGWTEGNTMETFSLQQMFITRCLFLAPVDFMDGTNDLLCTRLLCARHLHFPLQHWGGLLTRIMDACITFVLIYIFEHALGIYLPSKKEWRWKWKTRVCYLEFSPVFTGHGWPPRQTPWSISPNDMLHVM